MLLPMLRPAAAGTARALAAVLAFAHLSVGCERSRSSSETRAPVSSSESVPSASQKPTPLAPSLRCARGDQACGPLPASASPNAVHSGYDPSQARRRSIRALGLSIGNDGAVCEYDGECVLAGCGNHCAHWSQPAFVTTCEVRAEIWDHFCGCFEQRCQWFSQANDSLEWESSELEITPHVAAAEGRDRDVAAWPQPYALETDRGLSLGQSALLQCLRQSQSLLPQQLSFVLDTDAEGRVRKLTFESRQNAVRDCFQSALNTAQLLGGRSSFSVPNAAATLRGSIRAWVARRD